MMKFLTRLGAWGGENATFKILYFADIFLIFQDFYFLRRIFFKYSKIFKI
jgi:hypothetical protein